MRSTHMWLCHSGLLSRLSQQFCRNLSILCCLVSGVGTGGGGGTGGTCPPNFFKGLKVPCSFVMKSVLFVQANVAVNTKLTSKVPFLFENFDIFLKNLVKNAQFRVWYNGKILTSPPRPQHFFSIS